MSNKMKNMKINKRLMLSYVVILLLLIGGTLVSIWNLISIGNQIKQFYEHPFQVSSSANIINAKFEQMQKSVFRALSTMDQNITQEAITNSQNAKEEIEKNIEIAERLYLGNPSDVDNLKAKLDELIPMQEHVLELASNNQNDEAAAYMEEKNIPCIKEIQSYLDILIQRASTTGVVMIDQLQSKQLMSIIVLSVFSVSSILISVVFAKFITDSITKPINQMEQIAENLVNGKLDTDMITYTSQDEIGMLTQNMKKSINNLMVLIRDISFLMGEISSGNLAIKTQHEQAYVGEFLPMLKAMRQMTSNVSQTIRQIDSSSEQVSIGSSQMAENAQGLAEGATEQAGAVEELNVTVDSIADAAQKTVQDSKEASEQVNNSAQKAENSRKEMEKLTEAMQRIDATSKQIENIIAAIEDIASQTNLLSLNAAIEAARAGEAGKGFAVVADQIGKLASDSAQSAADTRELIMKTLEEIQIGNDITITASKAFAEIIGEIETFAKIAERTSEQSTEQYNSLQMIRNTMEQISSVVQNNSAAAQESSATSEELAAQAENLRELVAKFRLKEE